MSTTTIPPWRISPEPTAEELANMRADLRLAEIWSQLGNRGTIDEQTVYASKEGKELDIDLIMNVKEEVDADPDWAMNLVTKNPDGTHSITKVMMSPAPPHVRGLLAEDPFLITGLAWSNLAIAGRMELCTSRDLGPELVVNSDIRQVLPDATQHYLEEWQRLINAGTVWNVAGQVGRKAAALIEAGFCLEAPERTKGDWNDGTSRHDVPAGLPGSAAFVRAMMGDAYLAWIEAVR